MARLKDKFTQKCEKPPIISPSHSHADGNLGEVLSFTKHFASQQNSAAGFIFWGFYILNKSPSTSVV